MNTERLSEKIVAALMSIAVHLILLISAASGL